MSEKKVESNSTPATAIPIGGGVSMNIDEDTMLIIKKKLEEIELTKNEDKKLGKHSQKLMKDLNTSLSTLSEAEKVKFLINKCQQNITDKFKLEKKVIQNDETNEKLNKEILRLGSELNKSNLIKTKLESLFKEVQRRNDEVMEHSKRVAMEEDSKRKDLSDKFNSTLKDVSAKLNDFNEQNERQAKYIDELQEKIKTFEEISQKSNIKFDTVLKKTEAEASILVLKLHQQMEMTNRETAKSLKYKEEMERLVAENLLLKEKVKYYEDNFGQFQDIIKKSNEKFLTFKKDMDKLTSMNRQLEKENKTLNQKSEGTNKALINMVQEITQIKKQNETLKNLSKSLSTERSHLQSELKKYKPQDLEEGTDNITTTESSDSNEGSPYVTPNSTDIENINRSEDLSTATRVTEVQEENVKDNEPVIENIKISTTTKLSEVD